MSLVDFEANDDFAWIRINREEKRNAMNQEARDGVRDGLQRARNEFPVVIVTGTGGSFCAGIDLKEVEAQAKEGSTHALEEWREINLAIRDHPAVVIAAVNGIALGGGVTLIGCCDLAIAANEAQMGMPEVGFGMFPNPAGPSTALNLTRKRAAWMVLTAERIGGQQAAAWGLVNESVPLSELEKRVGEVAQRLAQFDPATLTESKRTLDQIPLNVDSWRAAFEAGVETNARIQETTRSTSDALERFARGERNPGQGRS
ncbi:MAG: enoyl-CoA hydratase/isomerase family protein [Pseudomonadota bacterium]